MTEDDVKEHLFYPSIVQPSESLYPLIY